MEVCVFEDGTLSLVFPGRFLVRGDMLDRCRLCRSAIGRFDASHAFRPSGSIDREPFSMRSDLSDPWDRLLACHLAGVDRMEAYPTARLLWLIALLRPKHELPSDITDEGERTPPASAALAQNIFRRPRIATFASVRHRFTHPHFTSPRPRSGLLKQRRTHSPSPLGTRSLP
jgi:hypothetical protein